VLNIHLNFPGQQTIVDWGKRSYAGACVSVTPSGSTRISFKPGVRSTSDSFELTASCFSLDLLGVELGPTMFAVTSGYSMSENDLFFLDCRLLAESEAADNWLKIEGLFV